MPHRHECSCRSFATTNLVGVAILVLEPAGARPSAPDPTSGAVPVPLASPVPEGRAALPSLDPLWIEEEDNDRHADRVGRIQRRAGPPLLQPGLKPTG